MNQQEGIATKVLPLLLILLTSAVAILILSIRDQRSIGSIYSFVVFNRDTIGLVIQVVSAALGACQVIAITSLVNLSARLRMQKGHSVEFRRLKFLAAITSGSSQAIRSSLPTTWLASVVFVVLTLKIPAALWAGALTPIIADVVKNGGQMPVPTYPDSALSAWQSSFKKFENGTTNMDLSCTWKVWRDMIITGAAGTVSTCPAIDLINTLLGSLATAAAGTQDVPQPYARVDSAGWTILGRSFGVGSSPGMVAAQDIPTHEAPILAFDYFEMGYLTNVSCARNESSNYTISETNYVDQLGTATYLVTGTLPNSIPGQIEEYPLSSNDWVGNPNLLAWSTVSNNGENILAVAATGYYQYFDKLQCSITFKPSRFNVNVNITDNIITVSPPTNDHAAEDIEPTGQFLTSVFYAVEQISRISGNTVISSLGTPLEHNTHVISVRNSSLSEEDKASLSLEYGLVRLIEGLLVANAQSQMWLLNDTATVPLSIRFQAIRVGSNKYIYAVLVSNLVVLIVIVLEAVRTRLWRGLTSFDFSDITNMARAASVGGTLIAERCLGMENDHDWKSGSDRLRVTLRSKGTQWALLPASELASLEGSETPCNGSHVCLRPVQWKTKPGFELIPKDDVCGCDDQACRNMHHPRNAHAVTEASEGLVGSRSTTS